MYIPDVVPYEPGNLSLLSKSSLSSVVSTEYIVKLPIKLRNNSWKT